MHRTISSVALAVALSLALAARAHGQFGDYTDHPAPLPAPMGELVADLVAAVNADDAERFIAFLDAYADGPFRTEIPDARHRQVYRQIRRETGGLDYYAYRTYDPPRDENEHVVILQDRLTGAWRAFVIATSPERPGRLVGLSFTDARRPSTLPPEPALTTDELVAEMDALVDRLVEADRFSGTILVAKDGEVVYERATGPASKRFGVPNDLDTRFNLGSMNKMFTAVAIAQLVGEGKLGWDDALSEYVDESWLSPDVTERVRIKHLLNHTSGLGSYFNETFWRSSRDLYRNIDDYKPLINGETLAFEPGTDWRYSNTGFFLLGVVIEKVTGRSYFDVIRDRVYEPAGMTRSGSFAMDEPIDNLAIGYEQVDLPDGGQVWRNNVFLHVIKGGPAGGGFSTARDLHAFDRALRSGTLLVASLRDELWAVRPEEASPSYGYGFSVEEGPLGTVVGHGGGFPGISAQLDMYIDAGHTVAVLSNYGGAASPVAARAASLLARVE